MPHIIPHPFGIIGLALNTLAALGLLKFSSNPDAEAQFPPETMKALRSTMPEVRRPYERAVRGFRASICALALGFVFQLVDLLIT